MWRSVWGVTRPARPAARAPRPDDPVEAPHGQAPAPGVPEERRPGHAFAPRRGRRGARRPPWRRAGRSAPSGPCPGPARCPRGGPASSTSSPVSSRDPDPGGVEDLQDRAVPAVRRLVAGGSPEERLDSGRSAGGPGAARAGSACGPRGPGSPATRPRRIRKRKKLRRVARRRAMDVRARPRSWRSARYARSTRASASTSAPSPRRAEEAEAVEEVGPVAPDRVGRGSALGREVPEERGHRRPAWLAAGRLHAHLERRGGSRSPRASTPRQRLPRPPRCGQERRAALRARRRRRAAARRRRRHARVVGAAEVRPAPLRARARPAPRRSPPGGTGCPGVIFLMFLHSG